MRTNNLMFFIWFMSLLLLFLQCDNANVVEDSTATEEKIADAEEGKAEDTEEEIAATKSDERLLDTFLSEGDIAYEEEVLEESPSEIIAANLKPAGTTAAPEEDTVTSPAPASSHPASQTDQPTTRQRPKIVNLNKLIGAFNRAMPGNDAGITQTIFGFIEERSADILNTPSTTRQTLLHAAAWHNREDILDRLIAKGVDLLLQNERTKHTALHLATRQGHIGIMKKLIKAAEDQGKKEDVLNARATFKLDPLGAARIHVDTPLILAVKTKQPAAAKLLLESGADPSLRATSTANKMGWTLPPYSLARTLRKGTVFRKGDPGMQPVLDVFEEFKQSHPEAFEGEATFFKRFKNFGRWLRERSASSR